MQNTKFINLNEFDLNKLKVQKINTLSESNKNSKQFTTFVDYDNESFILISDVYTCAWSPINKISENYPNDDSRSFFCIYETEELKILFDKFRNIDNKITSPQEKLNYLAGINNFKNLEYTPIVKSKQNLNGQDEENNKNPNNKIYQKDHIKIKFKKDFDTKNIKTKIMGGTIANNKFLGNKIDTIKTITDLTEHFKYGCKFRMFLKVKKIWFEKKITAFGGFRKQGTILECVRLDIINDHNVQDIESYGNFDFKDCKNITINGENKKVIDMGNGLLKIIDGDLMDQNKEKEYKKVTIKKSTNYNIKESNNKIFEILKNH